MYDTRQCLQAVLILHTVALEGEKLSLDGQPLHSLSAEDFDHLQMVDVEITASASRVEGNQVSIRAKPESTLNVWCHSRIESMATWRNGSAFGFDRRRHQKVAGSSPAVVMFFAPPIFSSHVTVPLRDASRRELG